MGNELGKLEPPKLFGRKKPATEKQAAPESTAPESTVTVQPAPERPEPPTAVLEAVPEPPKAAEPRVRRPVAVNGHLAALVAGVVSGAVLVGLIWLGSSVDDSSDSKRLAFGLLVAIFALAVVAGAVVLRVLKVASPGTIAFLATAVVAVIAVVALGQHMDDLTGAIAGFVLTVAAYPAARFVTLRYIDA